MATAVNDVKITLGQTVVKSAPSWSPGSVNTATNSKVQVSSCEKRPDVIHNAPDKWGNRPPSGWMHDWFRFTERPSSFSTMALPGKSAWFNPEGSSMLNRGSQLLGGWSDLAQFGPSSFTILNTDNAAKTRVLNEVAGKKWDLGVTARELRETVGLARGLSEQLLASARQLQKGFGPEIANNIFRSRNMARRPTIYERRLEHAKSRKARSQREAYEAARNQWMQYNFGLRPLARDVQDASYALDHLRGSPLAVIGRAGHTSDYRITKKVTPTNCPYYFMEQVDGEYECHYAVHYTSTTEGVTPITTLGLDNPWSVGYETARLSWLFDYAIGMGDWLSSWTAVNGLQFVSGTKSTIWRARSSSPSGPMLNQPDLLGWVQKPRVRYSLECGRFAREVITSPITPAFAPQIKTQLGLTQLGNSLFVLSQFTGRRRAAG